MCNENKFFQSQKSDSLTCQSIDDPYYAKIHNIFHYCNVAFSKVHLKVVYHLPCTAVVHVMIECCPYLMPGTFRLVCQIHL